MSAETPDVPEPDAPDEESGAPEDKAAGPDGAAGDSEGQPSSRRRRRRRRRRLPSDPLSRAEVMAKRRLGIEGLREEQQQALEAIIAGRDVLLRLDESRPARPLSFEEARDQVAESLLTRKRSEALQALRAEVEEKHVLKITDPALRKAFEKAGFVNAIEVRQQPDDADWDPEDINYNTFRWITASAGFAMGPSRVNPKTGEILDADIIFDSDFLESCIIDSRP